MKAVKRVHTEVQQSFYENQGSGEEIFGISSPSHDNFSGFRVYVESYMDYLILRNIHTLKELADLLVKRKRPEVVGDSTSFILPIGRNTPVEVKDRVLLTMYLHAQAGLDALLDVTEESKIHDYAAFQEWKRHRVPLAGPKEGGSSGEKQLYREMVSESEVSKDAYGNGSSVYFMLVRMTMSLYQGKRLEDLVADPLVSYLPDDEEQRTLFGKERKGVASDAWWSDSEQAQNFWKSLQTIREQLWITLLDKNQSLLPT